MSFTRALKILCFGQPDPTYRNPRICLRKYRLFCWGLTEPEKSKKYTFLLWEVLRAAVPLFKDARSVSLYPYNRSQILQYVNYTK